MSETVSAPASAPEAAVPAAPPPETGPSLPAPKDTPAISISEAARLMRQRRTEGEARQNQAPPPRGEARSNGTPQQGEARATPDAPKSPLDEAFGPPPGATPPAEAAAPAIEIEGQRYSPDELRKQISLASDYTKKTQALAERERQIQQQADAIAQVLPHIQPELARLQQQLESVAPPDEQLAQTDPTRYVQELARWNKMQAEQQRIGMLNQMQAEAQSRAMAQAVEAAHKELATEFSFWADPKARAQAQREIVDWATSKGGFTPDELRGLTSAKLLRTMMKATQYDKWISGVKTASPAPQLAAPPRGVAPPPAPAAQVQQAEQAFNDRPNIRNAAALLSARRSNGAA